MKLSPKKTGLIVKTVNSPMQNSVALDDNLASNVFSALTLMIIGAEATSVSVTHDIELSTTA